MSTRTANRLSATLLAGLLVAAWCAAPPQVLPAQAQSKAIVGGKPTSIAQQPWQTLLVVGGSTLCGGSLIASTWVVTAAHCVVGAGPDSIALYSGISQTSQVSDAARLRVSEVHVHPGYDTSAYVNDVALLRIATPWTPGAERQAIALPTRVDASTWPTAGTSASISGWGQIADGGESADQLHQAAVQVLVDAQGRCGQYGGSYRGGSHICAGAAGGGVDTCRGDSGGPLVIDVQGVPTLAGVTSVGNGCAQAAYPGLYTRLTAVLPWLRQFPDIPLGPPPPPQSVSAEPLASGRAAVRWVPDQTAGGSGITTFTVTTSPGGASCAVLDTWCAIDGLTPGVAYSFVVQSGNTSGAGGASQPSPPIVAVDATGRAGVTVRTARVIRLARMPKSSRLVARSPNTCRVVAAGVRLTGAGTCEVLVRDRQARRLIYIAVT